jgi:hypothetical protein
MFQPSADGGQRYEDGFWRWDVNAHGKKLLRTHLQTALASRMPVRLIMTCVADRQGRADVDAGKPAHELPKTFVVRKNWIGEVVEFTDEKFIIDFRIV